MFIVHRKSQQEKRMLTFFEFETVKGSQKMAELASLFTEDMVLQSDEKNVIFGSCQPGESIELFIKNTIYQAKVTETGWRVEIGPFSQEKAVLMIIKADRKVIFKGRIHFGDVYLLAGQSNMEFSMKDELNFERESQNFTENDQAVYFFQMIDKNSSMFEANAGTRKWQKLSGKNLASLSGIGYYFQKKLMEKRDRPIGLIELAKGGTSASCWLDKKRLQKDQGLERIYWEPYSVRTACVSPAQQNNELCQYKKTLGKYADDKARLQEANPDWKPEKIKEKLGGTPWPPPLFKDSIYRPGGLFEKFVRSLAPYRIKAVIWYQGEEDAPFFEYYERLLTQLIENWRELWQCADLPFYIVQLPRYAPPLQGSWAGIREQQQRAAKKMKHVQLISTIDCGEKNNIHPVDKSVIGTRLAEFILAGEAARVPKISAFIFTNNTLRLVFDNLTFSHTEELLKSFQIFQGEKSRTIKDIHLIDQNTVELVVEESYNELTYSFADFPMNILKNEKNVPLAPFRIFLP